MPTLDELRSQGQSNIRKVDGSATGIFGTFTKEDQAFFNRGMAEAEWLNNIDLLEYQNEYNSPISQANRMRDAGLNPDLLGVEQGGTSADFDAPSAQAPEGTNGIETVAHMFSVFNTALGIANGLMSFKSAQESLQSQVLDNVNKVDGFATSFLVDQLVPESFTSDGKLVDDIRSSLISSSRSWAQKRYGMSSKMSRRFEDAVMRKIDSPDFLKQFYETMNMSEDARQSYLSKTTGDLYSQADETMRILLDAVIREQNAYIRSGYKRGRSENYYQDAVFSSLDAGSFAANENMMNVYNTANARREFYGKSFYYNWNKNLYKSYKSGNIVSGIVLGLGTNLRSVGNSLIGVVGNLVK